MLFRSLTFCLLHSASHGSALAAEGKPISGIQYPRVATVDTPRTLATIGGITIAGGFGSALAPDPNAPGYFYLLTDRGPNADSTDAEKKVFPVPGFAPRIGRFKLEGDRLRLVKVIELRTAKGRKLTGLPNPDNGNTGEIAVDLDGRPLGTDPDGIDSEGLVAMKDGSFWISDEYGPWLLHVDAAGRTIERVGPFSGRRSLPHVLALRRPNRGMESLTLTPDGNHLVEMMQSPLDNPDVGVRKTSRSHRIVVYDHRKGTSRQFTYLMESPTAVVSEIAAISATSFIVSERDQLFPGDPKAPAKLKRIYRIDIANATDVSDPENSRHGKLFGGKTLEQLSDEEIQGAGIAPANKELVVDLLALPGGYPHDKSEGLAIINDSLIAVSNDDDFGIIPDGKGGIAAKQLPGEGGRIDVNRIYFIPLDKPLR